MDEPVNRLIRNLSNEDYHRHLSLSKSQLAEFLISPAHRVPAGKPLARLSGGTTHYCACRGHHIKK